MSESLVICDVDKDVVKKVKVFRFRKNVSNAAIILKIDKDKQLVIVDQELEDISIDDLREELPERQPRYIIYSYKYQHDDGRVSYPLCFIFSCPAGCRPDHNIMYTGSKKTLEMAIGVAKMFEIRNIEEMTEEWLQRKLGFIR